MIRFIKYLILILIGLVGTLLIGFMILLTIDIAQYEPIKELDINEVKLKKNEVVYICQFTMTTGPDWVVIGDKKGFFDEGVGEYMIIEGEPFDYSDSQDGPYAYVGKTYIVKGKIIGEKSIDEDDSERFRVLKATDWYILKGSSIFSKESYKISL